MKITLKNNIFKFAFWSKLSNKLNIKPLFLISFLALGGCAALSEEECRITNWYDLGSLDGKKGLPYESQLKEYTQACLKAGIQPQRDFYIVGWGRGVASYCAPDQAYSLGRSGKDYSDVCTGDSQRLFLVNHRNGYKVYSAERKIADNEKEIKDIKDKIFKSEAAERNEEKKGDKKGDKRDDKKDANDKKIKDSIISKTEKRLLLLRIIELEAKKPAYVQAFQEAEAVPVIRQ